ncbi:LOB domain-containing protein 24 [Hibiscus syriacus]|uniref:LOB domain-containing protein 24 n=1 Tax=Hibiscus syriacus TaxID=106335 RepID=A0A6A3A6H1_HIBSY|nr:LOB domain-containing protein 24-like [Hibiscus syriacus]KAE8699307.1 LOB domain-containing protein 24 [Hibiscus syriacus]
MSSGRCAACRYLRRRCTEDCILSPYFPSNNPQRFVSVHRIYGASNVTKLLLQLPTHLRAEAADSLYFEAQCRLEDPVYGCVGLIFMLQQQIHAAESQLVKTQAEIAVMKSQGQNPEAQQAEQDFNNLLLQQSDNDAALSFPNQVSSGFI